MIPLSNAFWCGGYTRILDALQESLQPVMQGNAQSDEEPILLPKDGIVIGKSSERKMEVWVDVTPWGEPMEDWLKRLEESDGSNAETLTATRTRTVETYGGGKGSNPDWLGVSKGLLTFGLSRSRTIPTIPLTILFNLKPYIESKPMPQ